MGWVSGQVELDSLSSLLPTPIASAWDRQPYDGKRERSDEREIGRRVQYAITKIRGIGRRFSTLMCKKAEVDLKKRAGELSAEELERLVAIVSDPLQFKVPKWFLNRNRDFRNGKTMHLFSSMMDNKLREDLERMKKIRQHRGLRHYWGLKVRGQHTCSTGRIGGRPNLPIARGK